jgi:sec-independent protein translocase protein TatA
MGLGWPHLLLLALVIFLLFGRGKISDLMGDVAKGINSFKKGLADEDSQPSKTVENGKTIEGTVTRESSAEAKDKTVGS